MINNLIQIGFYTLSDDRCRDASEKSDLQRCELILSARCNFKCKYCRNIGGNDLPMQDAINIVNLWGAQHLKNIRFSGGEPTLYKGIVELVSLAKSLNVERIAISTNGSASQELYDKLISAGANDFSVSLDACCAEDCDKMSGVRNQYDKITENIKYLSSKTYVTVGVVLTDDNQSRLNDIITFADSLGVSDIRIIPAAQKGDKLNEVYISQTLLNKYPILAYRIANIREGLTVRGLSDKDSNHCGLILDDIAVVGNDHYPCVIYLRESGIPIGKIGPTMREDRLLWYKTHNTKLDPICSKNCLDVCREYNNKFEEFHK